MFILNHILSKLLMINNQKKKEKETFKSVSGCRERKRIIMTIVCYRNTEIMDIDFWVRKKFTVYHKHITYQILIPHKFGKLKSSLSCVPEECSVFVCVLESK